MENLNYNNLDISIIIPTFNFRNSFKKVFQKIIEQTIKPLEIIIINQFLGYKNNCIIRIIV